eukprot:941960-Prymnesium_polylepis.1
MPAPEASRLLPVARRACFGAKPVLIRQPELVHGIRDRSRCRSMAASLAPDRARRRCPQERPTSRRACRPQRNPRQ